MIHFHRYRIVYFVISASILIAGLWSLVKYGLRQSIDFTGGTLGEVHFQREIAKADIEAAAQAVGVKDMAVTQSSDTVYFFRLAPQQEDNIASVASYIQREASISSNIVRLETVGPILGKELLGKAVVAAALAAVGILLYIAYAFRDITFGISAVVALVHDLLVMLGVFSLLGRWHGVEVDTLFVTALLTTMSFSVHDTIVVFDRIREMAKRGASGSFVDICDQALTQTIVRSLTNSFTIIFMLTALILLGGDTIRWFIVALLVGTVSGTYSSPFVATPVLVFLHHLQNRRKQ